MLSSSFASYVYAQPPPDLPEKYFEEAYLGDAQIMNFQTFEGAFWQIEFDDPNNGGCQSQISFDAIMTIDGDVPQGPITIELNSTEWQDDYTLLVSTIKSKAGIENLPGTFQISHLMFKLRVNGVLTGDEIYPGSTNWVKRPTGLPSPCDCVSIFFDITNHKLIVGFYGC
jgi:hypothetical protein